ncbi:hypothetical protein D1AOALGA4SA_8153 [Olavius algarvensis Delta 1 endosymbiont]|nr:hypothetical protein D1AOALGA4SA_8153 [Olavius algarvensis Delta 1 endosymbiont]
MKLKPGSLGPDLYCYDVTSYNLGFWISDWWNRCALSFFIQ